MGGSGMDPSGLGQRPSGGLMWTQQLKKIRLPQIVENFLTIWTTISFWDGLRRRVKPVKLE